MKLTEQQTAYQKHYQKHGDDLNARRRERYANDPAYRDRVTAQRIQHTEKKRLERGITFEEVPAEYKFKIEDLIGDPPIVARNTLSGWVAKGLLPTPRKINGVYYFTEPQADAIIALFKAVAGRKRIFTCGEFDQQIEAVRAALNIN